MRNTQVFEASLLAVFIAATPCVAQTAKCKSSCTSVKNTCVNMGASDGACAADMPNV
jgi:hypothetical protein